MRLAYDAHMLSKFVLSFGSVNSILQKSAFLVVLPKRFIQTSDAQGPAKDTLSAAAFQVSPLSISLEQAPVVLYIVDRLLLLR